MQLKEFFDKNPKAAIAFSGGVDSAYLLFAAIRCGVDVKAYYAKSPFQPEFELEDAKRLAAELSAGMEILTLDVLSDPQIASNPPERCYHCKPTPRMTRATGRVCGRCVSFPSVHR